MKCHDWIFLIFTTIICCTATISIAQAQQRGRVRFALASQKDEADPIPNRDVAPKPSRPRSSAPRASSRFRATEQPAIQEPSASVESKETSRTQHRSSASRSRSDDRSSRKLDAEATELVPSIRSRKRVNSLPQNPIPPSDQPTKVQLPTASIDRTNIIRRGKSRSEAPPTSASPPNAVQTSHFRRRSDGPAEESTESVRKVRNFSSRSVASRADDEVSSELPVIVTTAKNNWRNAGGKRGSAKAKISERLPKSLDDDQLEDENYPEHFKLLLKKQNPKSALYTRNLPRPPVGGENPSYSRSNEVDDSTQSPARQRRLEHAGQESSDEILQVSRAIPKVRSVELKREDTARAALKSRRFEPPAVEVTKSESAVKAPLKSRRTENQIEALKSRRNDLSAEELSPKREATSRSPFKSRRDEPQTDAKPNEIIEATKPSKPLFVPRRAEPYRPKPTSTTPRSTTTLKSSRKPEAPLDARQKYKPRVNARLQFPTLKTKITSEDVSKGENEIANVKTSSHPIRPPHITKSKNLALDTPLVASKKTKSQKFSSRYRGDTYSRYQPKTESSKPVYTPTIPAVSTEPTPLQTDLPSSRAAKSVNLYNPENAALIQPPNDMNSGVVFDERAGVWNMVEPVAGGLTRSDISVDSSEEHPLQPSSVTVSIFEALSDILSKTPPTTSSTSTSTTTTTTTTSTTELPEIIQVPELKIDSMKMPSTTVNTHLITDADGENTTTNEITNNDRNGRILNSVDINQKQSTTTASNDNPTEPTTVPQYTVTVTNTNTSPPLTTPQTEQTTENDLTDSTLLLAPTTQPTFTNNIPTNFSANSFELTTLASNPPTSLPMPFLADALTTPGSSLITRPQLISAISNFLDTSVQNASETMATDTTTTTTTATTNTTTTTATLDTDTEQSTTSDASTTLSPPPTLTPSSTDTPPVTVSFLDLFTIQPKKVNPNTEPAVEVHPIYKEPDPYTTPVSRQQKTFTKEPTTGRPVNILTFFGTSPYPSIAVTGATSTDRIAELTTAFFDSMTSGVTTDSPLPSTTSREQDSTTYTTPQSTSRTQSLPIHLNSILGSTQKYDQTSPSKTVHTTESTTTVRSRFGNNRLPILPAGSVPIRNTTTSTTSSTTTTKTTSSSSTTTETTTTAETVTQTSPEQQLPPQLSNFIPDQQVPKPIKDFSVYGILPNNTVVRKRPTQVSRTLDVGLMVYGILPNRTVVRKYPNGTLAIVDSTQDVEVVDIDPQMLFNPFSELYRTSQSSLLLTTHRSTTSHRLIEGNHIVASSSLGSNKEVPSSTTTRWANSIKDATDSGSTEATTTNNDDDDENLIQLLSENEDNLLNSTSLVEANTENAVLLDILKRKYINTDIPSTSSNVVSLTTVRKVKQKSSIPANRDKNVSENTLSDSSEEKKKDFSSSSSEEDLLGKLFPDNGSTGPNRSNTDDDNVISKHFDTFANIGSIFTGNKGRALEISQRTKLYPIKWVMASQNTATKIFPIHTSQSATNVKNDSRSVIEAFLAEANRSHGVSAKSSVDGSKTVMPLRDGESKMIDFGVLGSGVYSDAGGVYLLDHKDRFEGMGVKGELFEGSGDDVLATTESEKKYGDTWKYPPDSIPVKAVYSNDYDEFGGTEGVSTTEMGSGDFDTPKTTFMYNPGEVPAVTDDISMKSIPNLTTTPTPATHHPIEPEYFIPVEVVYPENYFEQLPKYLEDFAHTSTTVDPISETDDESSSKIVHQSTSISTTTSSPPNSDHAQSENVIFEPKLSKSDQNDFLDTSQQNYSEILTSDVNSDPGPFNTLRTKNVLHSLESNSEESVRNDELVTSTINSKMSGQLVSNDDATNASATVTNFDTISKNSSDIIGQNRNSLPTDMSSYLDSKLLSVSVDDEFDANSQSINGSTSDKVSKSSTENYSTSTGIGEVHTSTKSSKTSDKFESKNNEIDSILSNVFKDSQFLNKSADVTISDTWSNPNDSDENMKLSSNLEQMPSVNGFLGNYDTDSVENVLVKIETDFDDENPMHDSSTTKASNADHKSLEDEGLLRLPNFDTSILTKSSTESNLFNSVFSSEFYNVPIKNESKLEYQQFSRFPNSAEKVTSDPISDDVDWVTWATINRNISSPDIGDSNSGLNLDDVGDFSFKKQSKVDQKSESVDVKNKSLNLEQSSEILTNAGYTEVQTANSSNNFGLSTQTPTEATKTNFDLSHSDNSEDENLQEKFIIVANVELSEQLSGNSNLSEYKTESSTNQSVKNAENNKSDTVWVEAKSSAISRDSQYGTQDEVIDDAEGGASLPSSEIEGSSIYPYFNSSTFSGIENPYSVSSPKSVNRNSNQFSKPLVPIFAENSTVSEYAQQPSAYSQIESNDSKTGFALLDSLEYLNSFNSTQRTFGKSSENKSAPSQVSSEQISSFDPQTESQIQATHVSDIQETSTERSIEMPSYSPNFERLNNLGEWSGKTDVPSIVSMIQMTNPVFETFYASTELNLELSTNQPAVNEDSGTLYRTNYDSLQNSGQLSTTTKSPSHSSWVQMLEYVSVPSTNKEAIDGYSHAQAENVIFSPKSDFDIRSYYNLSTAENKITLQEDSQRTNNNFEQRSEMSVQVSNESDDSYKVGVSTESEFGKISSDLRFRLNFLEPSTTQTTFANAFHSTENSKRSQGSLENFEQSSEIFPNRALPIDNLVTERPEDENSKVIGNHNNWEQSSKISEKGSEIGFDQTTDITPEIDLKNVIPTDPNFDPNILEIVNDPAMSANSALSKNLERGQHFSNNFELNQKLSANTTGLDDSVPEMVAERQYESENLKDTQNRSNYFDQSSKISAEIENIPFQYKMSTEDINDDDTDLEEDPKASSDENSSPQLERNIAASGPDKVSDKSFLDSTTTHPIQHSSNSFDQRSKIPVRIENIPFQYKMSTEDINDDDTDFEEDPKASSDENSNPQLERNVKTSSQVKVSDHSTDSNDKSFLDSTTTHSSPKLVAEIHSEYTHPPAVYYPMNMPKKSTGVMASFVMPTNMQAVLGSPTEASRVSMVFPKNAKPQLNEALPGRFHKMYTEEAPPKIKETALKSDRKLITSSYEHNSYIPVNVIYPPSILHDFIPENKPHSANEQLNLTATTLSSKIETAFVSDRHFDLPKEASLFEDKSSSKFDLTALVPKKVSESPESIFVPGGIPLEMLTTPGDFFESETKPTSPDKMFVPGGVPQELLITTEAYSETVRLLRTESPFKHSPVEKTTKVYTDTESSFSLESLIQDESERLSGVKIFHTSSSGETRKALETIPTIESSSKYKITGPNHPQLDSNSPNSSKPVLELKPSSDNLSVDKSPPSIHETSTESTKDEFKAYKMSLNFLETALEKVEYEVKDLKENFQKTLENSSTQSTPIYPGKPRDLQETFQEAVENVVESDTSDSKQLKVNSQTSLGQQVPSKISDVSQKFYFKSESSKTETSTSSNPVEQTTDPTFDNINTRLPIPQYLISNSQPNSRNSIQKSNTTPSFVHQMSENALANVQIINSTIPGKSSNISISERDPSLMASLNNPTTEENLSDSDQNHSATTSISQMPQLSTKVDMESWIKRTPPEVQYMAMNPAVEAQTRNHTETQYTTQHQYTNFHESSTISSLDNNIVIDNLKNSINTITEPKRIDSIPTTPAVFVVTPGTTSSTTTSTTIPSSTTPTTTTTTSTTTSSTTPPTTTTTTTTTLAPPTTPTATTTTTTTTTTPLPTTVSTTPWTSTTNESPQTAAQASMAIGELEKNIKLLQELLGLQASLKPTSSSSTSRSPSSSSSTTTTTTPLPPSTKTTTTTTTTTTNKSAATSGGDDANFLNTLRQLLLAQQQATKKPNTSTTTTPKTTTTTTAIPITISPQNLEDLLNSFSTPSFSTTPKSNDQDDTAFLNSLRDIGRLRVTTATPPTFANRIIELALQNRQATPTPSPVYIPARVSTMKTPAFAPLPNVKRPAILPPEEIERHRKDQASLSADLSLLSTLLGRRITADDLPQITQQFGGNKQSVSAPRRPTTTPRTTPRTTTTTTTTEKPMSRDEIAEIEKNLNLLSSLLGRPVSLNELPLIMQDLRSGRKTSGAKINQINAITAKTTTTTLRPRPTISVQSQTPISQEEVIQLLKDPSFGASPDQLNIYGKSNDAVLAAVLKQRGIGPTNNNIPINDLFLQGPTSTPYHTTRAPPPPPQPPASQRRPLLDGLAWLWRAWQDTAPGTRPSRNNRQPVAAASTRLESPLTIGVFGGAKPAPPATSNSGEGGEYAELQYPQNPNPSFGQGNGLLTAAFGVTRAVTQFLGAAFQGAAKSVQSAFSPQAQQNRLVGLSG